MRREALKHLQQNNVAPPSILDRKKPFAILQKAFFMEMNRKKIKILDNLFLPFFLRGGCKSSKLQTRRV